MRINRIRIAAILLTFIVGVGASSQAFGQGATQGSALSPSPSPSPNQPAITPLTPKEKIQYGAYATFLDPGAYVGPAINAYIVERRDVADPRKKNNDKFADGLSHFGRAFATHATGEFLGTGLFPVLFKQNPIYQRSNKQGVMARTGYALSRAFVTTGDNGKPQPNFSRLLGHLSGATVANIYERDTVRHRDRFGRVTEFNRRVGVEPTLKRFGTSIAVEALSHVLFDEFNVLKKILKIP